ncbi:disease resistance-responsive (dirigent-likeprotein) family protein [Striga asiatica]|uniref:Dirigent protein n=1 Tax=Striga asiatica TaxID=4170 RepID=A0A5A7PU29_STRAF|nr:disease resistance-responsive (dirigent-likeprotein) family protein [Striga asiatica]
MASSLKTLAALFHVFPIIILAGFTEEIKHHQADDSTMKTAHLHFYFHDIFGGTAVVDDPLTEGTSPESTVIGRAQGLYSMSSRDLSSLLMVMNFEFTKGKYNGSSLSVLGRNPFLEAVRELPVVGGSGIFRFARGYALAKTQRFNLNTGNAVVEYNVYVMHP